MVMDLKVILVSSHLHSFLRSPSAFYLLSSMRICRNSVHVESMIQHGGIVSHVHGRRNKDRSITREANFHNANYDISHGIRNVRDETFSKT
jgi:hypothetical protein